MPKSKGKNPQMRVFPDDLAAVKRYRKEKGYTTNTKAHHEMLKERNPVFIEEQRQTISDLTAKVRNYNADIKKWERREQEWKQEYADYIREERDLIRDYEEKIQDLGQQNKELREKLRLQPLGNVMDDALSQFQRPEQNPLASEGIFFPRNATLIANPLTRSGQAYNEYLEKQRLRGRVIERARENPNAAMEGITREDLISKVDSTREAIDNIILLLTEDYNRLSEGMAVPT